ncbi:MAG: hypothetical protein AB7S92_10130 [Parvibaculaceae bacterium]
MMRKIVLLTLGLLLAGCGEDPNSPYLSFAGGGFIFNYRNAVAFYGFVAKPLRSLPDGSVIEAQFEVPGSPEPAVKREKVVRGQVQYSFKSPDLTGIVPHHRYKAVMRLIDAQGKEVARYERDFHTDVDQASLPDQPLVVGPGYQRNPNLKPGTLD